MLALIAENTVASPKLSMYSSILGSAYESPVLTAFSFRYSAEKRGEPILLKENTVGAVHSVVAGSITFSVIIRLIFAVGNFLVVRPARYEAQ